jgi:predicted Zn-dependent protease
MRFQGYLRCFVLLTLAGLFGCARNPVTGKREISFMSTEQEIAMGKESHPSIVATMGLYEDKRLQNFLNEKGQAMAKISHRPDLPFQFYIVDSPVVNAFAVPGGYVYFTRGIMAHFNNEAEFAGVLGHEIGHITARHSVAQQRGQILSTIGLIGGAVLAPDVVGQNIEGIQQGLQVLLLSYSRAHESQSDEIGVEYSSKIGYDAHQMANFFATIKRLQDNSGQEVPSFLSTHPDPGNRFSRVHELAKNYQTQTPAAYRVDRESYLRLIDGMVFGEDPKQGFVEGNAFYHPVLKFQFPIPVTWQHQNSPEQFQMVAKDQKSGMILTLAPGASLDEAAQGLVKQLNLKVLQNGRTTINGNPALVLISQPQPAQAQQQQPNAAAGQGQQPPAGSQQSTTQIGTWLIQYNGAIYALHGISATAAFANNYPTFQSVAQSFRALTDPDKLNRQPDRVQVRPAPRDGTFREVATAMGMPASRLEELGVLNSLKADDRVARGSLLKIISR